MIEVSHMHTQGGPFLADGVQVAFPYRHPFIALTDLHVYLTDTLGNVTEPLYGRDYTVSGVQDAKTGAYLNGGWITFALNAPPQGSRVNIIRRTARTQPIHFTTGAAFPSSNFRLAMLRLLLIKQETGEHWMGYATGAPSAGFYEADDYLRLRSQQVGTMLDGVNVADGDPGSWQIYPSILIPTPATLYYLGGLNQSNTLTPKTPLPSASALKTGSGVKVGFAARVSWSVIEPNQNQYDWTIVDAVQALAAAAGVSWSLSIKAGVDTPGWVYSTPPAAQQYIFIWNQTFPAWNGAVKGQFVAMPVPWDSAYLNKWSAMVTTAANRYKNDSSLDHVVLTGMNGITQETLLPHKTSDPLTTNNDANWTAAGYSTSLIEGAWSTLMALFNAQWGTKRYAMAMGPDFFPFYPPDEGVVLINNLIAAHGYAADSRGIIMNGALSPTFVWSEITGNSQNIDTAFQMVGPLGPSVVTAVQKGVGAGAKYIEVYPADLQYL